MVVVGLAATVDRVAPGGPEHVYLAGIDKHLKGSIDGGQTDLAPRSPHLVVDILRTAEASGAVERIGDSGSLPRRARLGCLHGTHAEAPGEETNLLRPAATTNATSAPMTIVAPGATSA